MNPPLSAADIPQGFTFSAAHCGLKRARLDLGIVISEKPAAAAAVLIVPLVSVSEPFTESVAVTVWLPAV